MASAVYHLTLAGEDRLRISVAVAQADGGGPLARVLCRTANLTLRIEDADPRRLIGALREVADTLEREIA